MRKILLLFVISISIISCSNNEVEPEKITDIYHAILLSRADEKLKYELVVREHFISKGIYVDYEKIDSEYLKVSPEVQGLLNARRNN